MFAVLELYPVQPQGMLQRIRYRLRPPQVTLEKCSAFGVPYSILHAPAGEGEPDWAAIAALAGEFAGQILLPDNLLLPPGCGLAPLRCPKFARRLLLETACALVARSRMPVYRRVVGLVDPEGDFCDMLPVLLRHYAAARVQTRQPALYARVAEDLMETMGAPLIYGETPNIFTNCILILSPEHAADGESNALLLAGRSFRQTSGAYTPLTDLRPEVPQELCQAAPPGIAPHRYAAALYDYGNAAFATPQNATHMRCGYRLATLDEIAAALATDALQPQLELLESQL